MKFVIALASLAICLSFVILPGEQRSPLPKEKVLIADQILKESLTTEKDILCVSTLDASHMYCIDHQWIVKEYQSGKIEVEEKKDTLWVKQFPPGQPCPGASFELSMK